MLFLVLLLLKEIRKLFEVLKLFKLSFLLKEVRKKGFSNNVLRKIKFKFVLRLLKIIIVIKVFF